MNRATHPRNIYMYRESDGAWAITISTVRVLRLQAEGFKRISAALFNQLKPYRERTPFDEA